jgi:choline dehydrogenase-like flavoprotein
VVIDYLDRSSAVDFDVDVCIVGAGPAGISIARTFIGSGTRVCVVESGGLHGEEDIQKLYEGTSIGSPALDPATCRMRAFGGSSNVWGGGCIPLDQLEIERRDWVPYSGWPLSYAELEPHYRQARAVCGVEAHEFVAGSFLTPPARVPVAFDARTLVNQVFVLSPLLFGKAYRSDLERAANIHLLLHANLLELEASDTGSTVRQARIGSLDGRRGTVRARHYVLACGGIENARLLLLSNSVVPQGLGNRFDLVGRYFMDHPSGKLGTVHTDLPDGLTRPYDRSGGKGRAPAFPELCLSADAARERHMLSGRVRPVAVESPLPGGIRALRDLRARLHSPGRGEDLSLEGRMAGAIVPTAASAGSKESESIVTLALRVAAGTGDIAGAFMRKLADKPTVKTGHIDLVGYFEQAPNPDSRITLGTERDALGQRKVCVDWQLTPLDWHTYRTAAGLFGEELAQACRGHFQPEPWLQWEGQQTPPLRGTSHHMGTTRMADDPQQGVVDRECKVHGVDNLYVVGSSVFPTSGWEFPTFTIVAMSLRLADHLRGLLEMTGL